MVRRLPARPSQLPNWYSSGVPAGPTLRRVDPLHFGGLHGGNSAFHTSLGGQSVGSYTFAPEAEASGQKAYSMWWIMMIFHSLESSAFPFPGDQYFLSHPSCAPSTLGNDLSVWRHGNVVPLALPDTARFPEEEHLWVTYVT